VYKKYQQIHFVGIGGVGMSGIAEVLLNLGYRVTGSDQKRSELVERLERLGAKVFLGHEPSHVEGAHVVVYSSAVARDNVEVQVARQRGVPVIPRAEMLAELMRLKYGIAIAGTHGKTTTTSMVAAVLGAAGLDPTVVVGGRVHSLGANARLGQGEFLVAEADESDGSFLKLTPTIAVVTTVDAEHLDHYADLDAIRAAFLAFVNKVPFYGSAVLCLDQPNIQQMIPLIEKRVITYGLESGADLTARRLSFSGVQSQFEVLHRGRVLGSISIQVPGRHNVLNALAAVGVGLDLEAPFERIQQALGAFAGVQRRFQIRGEAAGVLVVDDYGHHPAEIHATLAAAKAGFDRRVITVFQPHRYSRTHALRQEFLTAFYQSDVLIVMDIYVVPQDVEDIRLALGFAEREQLPVEIVGGGNNLLVRDRGIRGVVLKLEGCLGRADFRGEEAVAGAGVGLSALIREAAALNLGGIECLVGIPATIGGAVAMNAGTADGWIGDFVSAVYFLHPDGSLGEFKPAPGTFTYRNFNAPPGAVLIGCRLRLHRKPLAEIQKEMKQRLKVKKSTQPLALASAGCVWKNPAGDVAARMIEKCGLKGKRINGAEISSKHANFIVNRGGATAADILALMDLTRERVQSHFSVTLEPEIRIVGE